MLCAQVSLPQAHAATRHLSVACSRALPAALHRARPRVRWRRCDGLVGAQRGGAHRDGAATDAAAGAGSAGRGARTRAAARGGAGRRFGRRGRGAAAGMPECAGVLPGHTPRVLGRWLSIIHSVLKQHKMHAALQQQPKACSPGCSADKEVAGKQGLVLRRHSWGTRRRMRWCWALSRAAAPRPWWT